MIRIRSGVLAVLLTAVLLAGAMPVLAQSDLFIRKHKREGGESAPKSIFVPRKEGSKQTVFTPPKSESAVVVTAASIKDFDPQLLEMKGREPRNVQELLMAAHMHRAPAMAEMNAMRAQTHKVLAAQEQTLLARMNSNAPPTEVNAAQIEPAMQAPKESSAGKKKKVLLFNKKNTGVTKPKKVFQDY